MAEEDEGLISVVVDIDDTLIDTRRRMQAIWREVLGRRVPLQDVETLNLREIFMKHAPEEQREQGPEHQRRFFELLLCEDEEGVELAGLDEPIPFADETLRAWSDRCKIVYLTGRPETTCDLTMTELERFGFPTENIEMAMVTLEDWRGGRVNEARERLLNSISQRHDVVRVVDDYPGYFTIYSKFDIPDRIGLLLSKRHTPQDFIDRGATRVVKSWEQLIDDLPNPT
ncbi:MAG: hypothetical protein JSV18_07655 [Candidatus Bathyarchaeota archaeon]|nr:MAG: hypothetical protein JSV18_07655 [Candidatus Bathyarchaeota archaeon]